MVFGMDTSRSDPQRERTHARYALALAGTPATQAMISVAETATVWRVQVLWHT